MDVKLSLLDKFLLDIILCPFSVLLDLICSCVEEDYFYIFFLLQLLYFVSYLIDLCLSMNILSYAFFKKFYSFTIAYMIYFSFEYSVQSFFLFSFFLSFFLFFFFNYRHPVSGKESTCNAGDLVQFLGQEEPLEKG